MSENELAAASREDLIGYIRHLETGSEQQKAVIAALQARISALEQKLAGRSGPGMPGNRPVRTKPAKPAPGRKKRVQGFGRPRLPPTETVQHTLETCSDCGTALVGCWIQATREVTGVPIAPVRVIAHQYVARVCPLCQKRRVPSVDLAGIVLAEQQRLGIGVVSLIATLRDVGRLPFATIQWYLTTVHQLHLSVGELVRVVAQVAERATGTVEQIQAAIQASPVVHADDTGWREKGTNGYAWTFRTPTHHYFIRGGRNKEMVDAALGTVFAGVLVCDFCASYDHYRVAHHHVGGVPGKVVDFDHRTYWHTHAGLTYSHGDGPRTRTDTTPRRRTCTTTPRRPTPQPEGDDRPSTSPDRRARSVAPGGELWPHA
jgi:hypothetical protein